MTFPDVTIEVAFESDWDDLTPTWTDVTDYGMAIDSVRGRSLPIDVCDPGTATFLFNNREGHWDADNSISPFYGHLRPNKLIRVSSGSTRLFTGYVDSLTELWPEGADEGVCEVRATDRFKLLARRDITTTRSSETADDRITALLASVPTTSINTNAYAARTLIGIAYAGDEILLAAQDAARSDGGVLFCDSSGTPVFQTATFRQTNTRSTTSQGTFVNDDDSLTGVKVGVDLTRSVDDAVMANNVRLTDGHGVIHHIDDTVAESIDGIIELDLGSTLLDISSEADDRVTEVLNLLIDAKPRWSTITLDNVSEAGALAHSIAREISDRITVAFIAPGRSAGTQRDQFIESVAHSITFGDSPSWLTTFGLSSMPGDASVGRVALP